MAAEEFVFCTRKPIDNTPQFVSESGQFIRIGAAAIREALAPLYAGPQAAVDKTVVGICSMQMLRELLPGDVAYQADVGAGRLQRLGTVQSAQIAAVPGAAKQGRGDL